MSILTSSGSFIVVAGATPVQSIATAPILPVVSAPSGNGRLVHPTLGAFDYEVKPDEWCNVDGDLIVVPTWAYNKTLTGGVNVLWQGNIKDVVIEERWKQSMAMTISQLRLMLAVFMNPVDPASGYVQLWPNYANDNGYKVIPIGLSVGGQGITLTDLINSKDSDGNPGGWVESSVVFTLKVAGRV